MTRSFLLAAVLLAGCRSHQSPRLELSGATVELDAFSGRPNPRWQLSVEEARELSARLNNLNPADARLPDVGLGYRGFYIDNADGQRVHITHGLIAFPRGEQPSRLYRDTRGAEAALKAQAIARGYGSVFGRG